MASITLSLNRAVIVRTFLRGYWYCRNGAAAEQTSSASVNAHNRAMRRLSSSEMSTGENLNQIGKPTENSRTVRRRNRCNELLAKSDHWITSADKGRTVVFYHPEQPFPYEHTRPLPEVSESDLREGDSVLKIQIRHAAVTDESKMYRPEHYSAMKPMFYDDLKVVKPNFRKKKLEAAGIPSPHEPSPREGV